MSTKKPLIKAFRGLFSGPCIFGLFCFARAASRSAAGRGPGPVPAADPAADPAAGHAGRVGNKKHAYSACFTASINIIIGDISIKNVIQPIKAINSINSRLLSSVIVSPAFILQLT